MHRLKSRTAKFLLGAIAAAVVIAGCNNAPSATSQESSRQGNNYKSLVAAEPAHTMQYSPTRATINGWIDTWGKPGAKSYVYIQNSSGKLINHYVFKGLPVSYCAALTPTQHTDDSGSSTVVLNNPSIDGVYYSGAQCNEYYGFDATTGAYIEFSVGLGQNLLAFSQPLPQHNVPSFAPTHK